MRFDIRVAKKPENERLEGIDAPEISQSFGSRSKQALSQLVFGKTIEVRKTVEDRLGRTLGIVLVDGVDCNAKMVEDGWAWHFRKYSDDVRLARLESEARSARRGLLSQNDPISPWECRARQKAPNDQGLRVPVNSG